MAIEVKTLTTGKVIFACGHSIEMIKPAAKLLEYQARESICPECWDNKIETAQIEAKENAKKYLA